MITLKKCFPNYFHPSPQKMKRRESYKIFGLGGSLGVFVNIFFSPPRQNVLARKRIALSLSHTSPHMKNRLPSCEILISSKKMWQARAKMNILPYLLKYINSIEQHSPAVYIFTIWLQCKFSWNIFLDAMPSFQTDPRIPVEYVRNR